MQQFLSWLVWPTLITNPQSDLRVGVMLVSIALAFIVPFVFFIFGIGQIISKPRGKNRELGYGLLILAGVSLLIFAALYFFAATAIARLYYCLIGPMLILFGIFASGWFQNHSTSRKVMITGGVALTYLVTAPWVVGYFLYH